MYNVNTTTTSQHWCPPRRLNAIRMSTFNPWHGRAGPGWLGPARRDRVRDCEFMMRIMYESEGWDKSLFSRITTKNKLRMKIINVPVILADESLFDIVRDHRQSQELHPGTIDTLQLCFIILRQLNFRLNTIPQRRGGPGYAPCQGLRERVDFLYNNYAARCLDFLLPILEFLRLIIQHHGVWNHGRISSLILTTSVRIIAHDSRRKSCHNILYTIEKAHW